MNDVPEEIARYLDRRERTLGEVRRMLVQVLSFEGDPEDLDPDTALFGTGLARPLEGRAAEWVARFDRAAGPKLSVDLPSGLDGDSGEALGGIACHAEETVTFHAPKRGLLAPSARAYVGRLSVVPLGLPPGWPRDGASPKMTAGSDR